MRKLFILLITLMAMAVASPLVIGYLIKRKLEVISFANHLVLLNYHLGWRHSTAAWQMVNSSKPVTLNIEQGPLVLMNQEWRWSVAKFQINAELSNFVFTALDEKQWRLSDIELQISLFLIKPNTWLVSHSVMKIKAADEFSQNPADHLEQLNWEFLLIPQGNQFSFTQQLFINKIFYGGKNFKNLRLEMNANHLNLAVWEKIQQANLNNIFNPDARLEPSETIFLLSDLLAQGAEINLTTLQAKTQPQDIKMTGHIKFFPMASGSFVNPYSLFLNAEADLNFQLPNYICQSLADDELTQATYKKWLSNEWLREDAKGCKAVLQYAH